MCPDAGGSSVDPAVLKLAAGEARAASQRLGAHAGRGCPLSSRAAQETRPLNGIGGRGRCDPATAYKHTI